MKVSMYIKNNGCSFRYHLDAEFPCAPRVGEFVSVDWDPVKEAIINNDDRLIIVSFCRATWPNGILIQESKRRNQNQRRINYGRDYALILLVRLNPCIGLSGMV